MPVALMLPRQVEASGEPVIFELRRIVLFIIRNYVISYFSIVIISSVTATILHAKRSRNGLIRAYFDEEDS
jgi:hypothetical protein